MNKSTDLSIDDGLELSLDTLDQWEAELDQFAKQIMSRLHQIAGVSPPTDSQDDSESRPTDDSFHNQS